MGLIRILCLSVISPDLISSKQTPVSITAMI
jgi:hypothetical protein